MAAYIGGSAVLIVIGIVLTESTLIMIAMKKTALAGLVALFALSAASNANAYLITISTANQGGSATASGTSFNADLVPTGFNASGAITASFNYSGSLDFRDTVTQNADSTGDLNSSFFKAADIYEYSLLTSNGVLSTPANADFRSVTSFLASSGSAANYLYGSFITVDLGSLAKGTNLIITHDDGASVYQNGVRIGTTTSAPTSQVIETVQLTSDGETMLYYARENGTPSVLNVSVPEPISLALLGVGMIGTGAVARRRRSTTAAKA